ncbi:POLIB, partial [Symbiodinium sp. KB8]
MQSPDVVHACDTEVADIDVASQSPVGNGKVICASIYSGPHVSGDREPRIWIDNMDEAEGTLEVFKPFFESTSHLKLWHNYGFDRHVLFNEGIDVAGLGGDTMHMARLWTTARAKKGGYSLESLSADLLGHRKAPMKERFSVPKLKKDGS